MTWAQTAKRYLACFRGLHARAGMRRMSSPIDSTIRGVGNRSPFRKCASDISFRSATAPACCSTPSIRCRIALTATASTTMRVRCCWRARLRIPVEDELPETMTAHFAAFIQHAWNPDTRRFRNFMSYDRRWLEESGLRRQPRPGAVGFGRMRAQRQRCVSPALGRRAVQNRTSVGREFFRRRAPGLSRCLAWMPIARWMAATLPPTVCASYLADRLMAQLSL